MRKLFLFVLLAFASPAMAQDTTIVANPGDSLVITTTTTTVVKVIAGEVLPPPVDTIPPPPPDTTPPPPSTLTPIVRVVGITAPTSIPADQIPDLAEGTICFAYDAINGGIYSRDANGFGEGGHLDIQLLNGLLRVRSQTTNTSFVIEVSGATGKHRGCYRYGQEMTVYLDGEVAGTNIHSGSTELNNTDIILGASCVQCVQDTLDPLGSFLNGELSELEIYDVPMGDSVAKAWSFFEDTTVVVPPGECPYPDPTDCNESNYYWPPTELVGAPAPVGNDFNLPIPIEWISVYQAGQRLLPSGEFTLHPKLAVVQIGPNLHAPLCETRCSPPYGGEFDLYVENHLIDFGRYYGFIWRPGEQRIYSAELIWWERCCLPNSEVTRENRRILGRRTIQWDARMNYWVSQGDTTRITHDNRS